MVVARAKLHAERGKLRPAAAEIFSGLAPRPPTGLGRRIDVRPDRGRADVAGQRLRGPGVPVGDRLALDLVAFGETRPAPALHQAGELPAEVCRIVDPGVHAEAAGGR